MHGEEMNYSDFVYSQRQVALMNQLRKLWMEHVFWTRLFIISTAADLGDLEMTTKRLLRNPSDFAALLRPLYGNQAADRFEELFTQHLSIAGDLVNAEKKKDTAEVETLRRKWYANADEIAAFLAGINPYWSKEKWQMLMHDHLQMTEQEAVLRLGGHYAEDIKIFDSIQEEALKMADYMFYGISRQFGI